MNLFRVFLVAFLGLALGSRQLCSQELADEKTIPQLGDDLGNLVDPGFAGEDLGGIDILGAVEETKTRFFFSLSAVDAEGAFLSGLIAGGSRRNTQVDIRYLNIGADDGSSSTDQFRLRLKQKIAPERLAPLGLALAAVGQHVDTRDASKQDTVLLSGAWQFKSVPAFSVLLNAGWSEKRPEQGESVDDVLVVVGTGFKFNEALSVGLDYTLENNINKAEDYSFAVSHSIVGGGQINFGVSKGGTVFGSYVVAFER